MKTSDILLGAAIIAVGVVVYRVMSPPPPAAPTPAPASTAGGILGGLLGGLAAVGAERLGEAVRGEREWW